MDLNLFQKKRLAYKPIYPEILRDLNHVHLKQTAKRDAALNENLRKLFPLTADASSYVPEKRESMGRPLRVGTFFSGGQASGGHNVLAGLFFGLVQIDPQSKLYGFMNGPSGLIGNRYKELKEKEISSYMNQGGFDCIGSGRTKIETQEQLAACMKACEENQLDGLVVIGGDDSNTNAAILAEYFLAKGCKTKVVGMPKTIDGDLRSDDIEISFGYDSACKTYSEIIGNIARDALSAKKYYHFIKLMGRSASHITLECALATQPNLALIAEERMSLSHIVGLMADLVCKRSELGKDYGVILIPEGLIEFIPEMQSLIASLNRLLFENKGDPQRTIEHLSPEEKKLFDSLGDKIQAQLLKDRDPHGNVQVSLIDTQVLLMDLVKKEVKSRPFYKGKFSAQDHFLGYEGRACFPTNFDANYAYSLGLLGALSIRDGLTGVICSVQNLDSPPSKWNFKAVPIVWLMHLENRGSKEKPVIRKALVDLSSKAFQYFASQRKKWETDDAYLYPGPIQFFGDLELTDRPPHSLLLGA